MRLQIANHGENQDPTRGGSHNRASNGGDNNDDPHNCEERWRKLKITIFNGEDASGWTNRVERYSELKCKSDEEKIQAVKVVMEGETFWCFK